MTNYFIKIFFIISILIGNTCNTFGQNFAEIGTEWYYHEGFAFSGDVDYIKFVSEKDTVINSIACKKISKRHKIECLNRNEVEYIYSINDTVYYYEPSINDFQILYDFNSEPNDHWEISINIGSSQNDSLQVFVDSVASRNINGTDLKEMFVTINLIGQEKSYNTTFIERIGDINYMFYWYNWAIATCDVNWTRGLQCFQDSLIGLYSTGLAESCDYSSTNTEHGIGLDNIIKIYPNPASNFINIEFCNDLDHELQLIGITGEIMSTKTSGSQIQLDLSSLSDGIYLLKIKHENQIISTNKIVKK